MARQLPPSCLATSEHLSRTPIRLSTRTYRLNTDARRLPSLAASSERWGRSRIASHSTINTPGHQFAVSRNSDVCFHQFLCQESCTIKGDDD
ncbi:hypothetical protein E2C01_095652 [Portunus trituberculatus]|uniref:Uncharacterized protein n=1 Tax=Portunus trituberculatus TaxID=210409 RepID=A0A5B7K0P4_PORTR|nr:hypothetical protein [Portunus trituberculatus]